MNISIVFQDGGLDEPQYCIVGGLDEPKYYIVGVLDEPQFYNV